MSSGCGMCRTDGKGPMMMKLSPFEIDLLGDVFERLTKSKFPEDGTQVNLCFSCYTNLMQYWCFCLKSQRSQNTLRGMIFNKVEEYPVTAPGTGRGDPQGN